jgi:hypothetical protein
MQRSKSYVEDVPAPDSCTAATRTATRQVRGKLQLNRISDEENYKFGWLQGSWKFLKEKKFWLRGLDLNQRPLGYEPNELPDCSTPRNYYSCPASQCQVVFGVRDKFVWRVEPLLGFFSWSESFEWFRCEGDCMQSTGVEADVNLYV